MKKLLFIIILSLLSNSIVAQSCKTIAIVNIFNIFQNVSQKLNIIKKLENEFKDRAKELQYIEQDIQKKMQKLQNNRLHININEKKFLEKSIISQRENFANKAQKFEQDNRRRQIEERDKILNCINNTIKNIAIRNGYDLIINSNSIAFANKIKDITNDVLKQIK